VEQKGTPKKRHAARWEKAFLAVFSRTGNVLKACKYAKVGRTNVYRARQNFPDFAAAWETAHEQAMDYLEQEAWRRATRGVKRRRSVYSKGEKIAEEVVTEFSDTLLIFLLKGGRPGKYKDRHVHEHGGPESGPVQVKFINVIEPTGISDEEARQRIGNGEGRPS
jgi:hypothetical protein